MSGTELSNMTLNAVYAPSAQVTLYENNRLFQLFPPKSDGAGSDGNIRWKVRTTGTLAAQATTEGASAPASNVKQEIGLYIPFVRYDAVAELSTEAQVFNPGDFGDPLVDAINLAARDLRDVACDALVLALVNSIGTSSTYGGQTRSSYSDALVSGADTSTAAISEALLDAAVLNLIDAAKGLSYDDLLILASPTLCGTMNKRFGTPVGAHNVTVRMQGDAPDGGFGRIDEGSYNRIPIRSVPRMDANTVLLVPRSLISIHDCGSIKISNLGKVGGTDRAYLEYFAAIKCEIPAWCYKLTNKS